MEGGIVTRRGLMGAAAAGGALLLAGDPLRAGRAIAARTRKHGLADAGDVAFRQGVASGEPAPHAITLWTHVGDLNRTAAVRLEVARDPGFRKVVHKAELAADERAGFSVKTRVRGLDPHEQYHYRFFTSESESRVGRFRTSPPDDSREHVRVAVFSCQDWQAGYFTSHRDLLDQDPDLVICLGDYIYERNFYEGPREDKTGRNRDGEVQSLNEYRDKYALYHSDKNLRDMRAEIPMVAIWDDHEVEDNWAGDLPGSATQDPRVKFPKRQRNGFQAFFEHQPLTQDPKDPTRIYGTVRLGRNLELFLLDERQYRSDQPCNDRALIPCAVEQREDPKRTLLGRQQTSWLKRGLRRSDAVWKGIANQVMIMSVDLPAGNPINPDQWDGYGANRSELLGYIHNKGISDVAFLTGDIHTFFAGDVTRSGRQSILGRPDSVATEFVCGSVTSLGLLHVLKGQIGVDVPPDIGALAGDGAAIPANNPHLVFSNLKDHGYALVEATSDELKVDYRSPRTTQEKKSPARTLASFTVERGKPEVQQT